MEMGFDPREGGLALERLFDAIETAREPSLGREDILALIERLFGHAPLMIDGFDRDGRCILWNHQCERVFGWTAKEVMEHGDPLALFYPDAAEYQAVVTEMTSSGGSMFQEWAPKTRDGRRLTTLWANVALPSGDMLCFGHDITAQRQAEHQQRLAASVFESSDDAIMITDAELRIRDTNGAFTRITGYAKDEMLGQTPDRLAAAPDDDGCSVIRRHLSDQDSWKGEVIGRRRNGEQYPLRLSITVVRDERDRVCHYVATFSDVTHLKRHQEELHRLARHDALTELPNRRHFAERLEDALPQARRNQALLAVGYLDLDGFKPINDRLGHAAGDRLLVIVGERLRHALRAEDLLARLGGDEFVLLLNELHDAEECRQVVERLRQVIRRPVTLDGLTVQVSCSIGITLYPQDDAEAETLLRHADEAMYRAKRSGKNRCCLFDPRQDA